MYVIDQSFTRLAPAIDFSDVVLDAPANAWCVLGSPPKHLQAVHSPALVKAWHERLVQALTQPTEIEHHKGHRRVQVLGNAIFDFNAQGQVRLWNWAFNERDLPELVQLPDMTVVAAGVPYKALWMDSYRVGALRSLVAYFPAHVRQCQNYVAWVSQALIELCWTEEVQEQVRSQIASALALDPQLLEIASQIQLSTRQRTPVRLEHYNHVLACKRDYLQLKQESPQFIELYALLSDDLRIGMESTASMKYSLRARGLGNSVWRLLSRVGTQWINEYLPYFDQERQALFECAIEIVQMASAFGTQELPPREVLHALIQLGGNPNNPSANFVNRVDDQFALCERLGAIMAQADAQTMEVIKAQAMAIFGWGSDHAESIPDAVMRRLTFKGILRKVREQDQLDQKRHKSGPAWTTPYQLKLADPNHSAVILDSALAIWQEGQLMRHCADKFVHWCASQRLLMVSLRDARQRHPLATVSFLMNRDRVQLHKFSGFANRLISDEAYALIQECRRQLQRQWQPSLHQETLEGQLMVA
jgi:hypothetical protein